MKKRYYLASLSLMALGLSAQANDFQGHFAEVRAGGSFPFGHHEVNANGGAGNPSGTNKISTRGPLGFAGIHYTYNMANILTETMDLGISLGADWFSGNSALRINTARPAEHYSVSQQTRYELALRTGSDHGKLYPFVKAGVVAGEWQTKARTPMGATNKKDLLWGATIGAGLDYKIHSRGILGVLVEGDWYANKNYDFTLANGNPSYAKITVKPLALNIALTYKYKLG